MTARPVVKLPSHGERPSRLVGEELECRACRYRWPVERDETGFVADWSCPRCGVGRRPEPPKAA